MDTRYLALFDCASIQSYVFSTNRLREIVGASELVRYATTEAVETAASEAAGGLLSDWDQCPTPALRVSSEGPPAEVLYQGGGNAVVVFACEVAANDCLSRWSEKLLRDAPGLRALAVAVPLGADLADALAAAHQALARLKLEDRPSGQLEALPLVRTCQSTGAAASVEVTDPGGAKRWLSSAAGARWNRSDAANARLHRELSEFIKPSDEFPLNFDELGGREGENHIAVVHADGNSMAERFRKVAEGAALDEGVRRLRRLSATSREAGRVALGSLLSEIEGAVEAGDLLDRGVAFQYHGRANRRKLPIRPLLYGGDDLTLVCEGRIGLLLAARYLTKLREQQASDGQPFSACAGVCICHAHYPFARAYGLAEDAMRSAKQRQAEYPGTGWIDWHIALSGATADLQGIRSVELRSGDGKELLWRPWAVTDVPSQEADHAWTTFASGVNHFQLWPRSRAKALRDALADGLTATSHELAASASRRYQPPVAGVHSELGWTDATESRRTSLYDMAEALDYMVDWRRQP